MCSCYSSNNINYNGKYAAVNRCEICNKPTQVNYASHVLYGSADFGANGACLCDKCGEATAHMTKEEEYLDYKEQFKLKKKK